MNPSHPARAYAPDEVSGEFDAEPQGCVLVVGGPDRLGREVVAVLLQSGFDVMAMSLPPAALPAGARTVAGDITDAAAVRAAMTDADAVVIALGDGTAPDAAEAMHLRGVQHVVAGATRAGVQVVLVTQVHLTPPTAAADLARILNWQVRGEEALRESPLGYTIVRPARLTDEPGGRSGLLLDQGAAHDGTACRADVARTCAEVLLTTSALCTTFELYETDDPPLHDWEAALSALVRDPPSRRRG